MSKDGNGKCPRRDSDIELPVPVLGPTGDIILGIHGSYRNHVSQQAKLVQGEAELRASTLIIQEGQDGPRKRRWTALASRPRQDCAHPAGVEGELGAERCSRAAP